MRLKPLFISVCTLFSISSAIASGSMGKHAADGVPCVACHNNGIGVPPTAQMCKACHYQDSFVKATEKFNFTARLQDSKNGKEIVHTAHVNPHDSYHFGREEQCTDCHKEHRPSNNMCSTCHDIQAWKIGIPR